LAWLDAFKLALTDECPLELCEVPHHRQQQIRYRRILAGERQVLVIQVDANSFGRQLLDNATEIIEVASVNRLSQTRVIKVRIPTTIVEDFQVQRAFS
jgi:hypothetical protein